VLHDLRKQMVDRLGRRGAIVVGALLGLAFVLVGGPIYLAAASASLVSFAVFAAVLVGPAVWVLTDARKRGVKRPFAWALFALVTNVAGALAYLLKRDDQPQQRPCNTCGRQVDASHAACPWCGSLQMPSKRSCTQCRNELDPGWRFCPYCRSEVGRAAPSA